VSLLKGLRQNPADCFINSYRPLMFSRAELAAKLHVLTLTPFYPSEQNEVNGCFVAEPLREIQRRGVTSSVMAVDAIYHRKHNASNAFPGTWIRYPRVPGNFGLSGACKLLAAGLRRKVRELHRHSPIDVIHAHAALPCGFAAKLIANELGVPFVVTVHGLDVFHSCYESGTAAGWRKQASISVYETARKVICISDKVRQRIVSEMGSSVATEVVYNGADVALFSPSARKESTGETPPTVLIVGNLLAAKGHELVLRSIAGLKDFYPGLRCDIIGEGADHDRFVKLASDLGLRDRVFFLGRRSRSEVAEAMRHCTIFVLPSRNEGLGCVYLEAMACAKPVVACHAQGIDEIIRHGSNGWLVRTDGLDELQQALHVLLANAELRARIGESARETIAGRFSISHQAEALHKIYTEGLTIQADG
jgi:teichuronic acid biosynthesis glycosyltransferase TuaC